MSYDPHTKGMEMQANHKTIFLTKTIFCKLIVPNVLHKKLFMVRVKTFSDFYLLPTWRTVVQQLVSCLKSIIIHVCIIGHKHHPQAFAQ